MKCLFAVCLIALTLSAAAEEPVLDRPVPERLTGPVLRKALEMDFSSSWENEELRTILDRLADKYKTAVLLDRSLDPNQKLDVSIGYQPLWSGFGAVAQSASAGMCLAGNTIYVGPPERAAKLRTLIDLRSGEPIAAEAKLPAGRVLELSRVETLHWNDLDEPRQIAAGLAKRAGVKIINSEAIPHDLWAAATLPHANFAEAMSLILIQFDLTFAWNADRTEIRLVPVPKTVGVEKSYSPAGGPSKRASLAARERFLEGVAKSYEQQYPGIRCRVDGEHHQIWIKATLEEHEALKNAGQAKPKGNPPAAKVPPVRRREFTLRVEQVKASDLLKELENSGIVIKYDAQQLTAKGIDLDQRINMDVEKAMADEFFRKICDPLGLKFAIDNVTVTLTPK